MHPKTQSKPQDELFRSRLEQIIDLNHSLCQLARTVNWSYFEKEFGSLYVENTGRPGKPIRLMVALHYLKHAFDESDESVVERFLENPYWQYFAGFEHFQHELPLDPTSLVKWRHRIGSEGMEKVFYQTLKTAQQLGMLKRSHVNKVNVDTTVQEKAIAFPTDASPSLPPTMHNSSNINKRVFYYGHYRFNVSLSLLSAVCVLVLRRYISVYERVPAQNNP